MIPAKIQQIAKATALLCAVGFFCFSGMEIGAGLVFAAASTWIIMNLLLWSVIMMMMLQPGAQKPRVGFTLLLVFAKLFLLLAGLAALWAFAPYTALQMLALVAGVSSVLFVTLLKAAGAKIVSATTPRGDKSKPRPAKV